MMQKVGTKLKVFPNFHREEKSEGAQRWTLAVGLPDSGSKGLENFKIINHK